MSKITNEWLNQFERGAADSWMVGLRREDGMELHARLLGVDREEFCLEVAQCEQGFAPAWERGVGLRVLYLHEVYQILTALKIPLLISEPKGSRYSESLKSTVAAMLDLVFNPEASARGTQMAAVSIVDAIAPEILKKANLWDDSQQDVIRTERLVIHNHEIPRDASKGLARRVYQAWLRVEDVPRPICFVTINEHFSNYVEWLWVDEQYRRQGIATEALRGIELQLESIMLDGVTDEGCGFVDAYENRFPSAVE